MGKSSSSVVVVVLAILLACSVALPQCDAARDLPAEEKPLRPQNVYGFGGLYPGPSINWVFPGPNGVTPLVGFGGMPAAGGGGAGGVSPFTPSGGGSGVVGVHGGGGGGAAAAAAAAGAAASKKP